MALDSIRRRGAAAASRSPATRTGIPEHPHPGEDEHRTDECHGDDAGDTLKRCAPCGLMKYPAADKRAGDAEQDVTEEPPPGPHDERGQDTCSESDNEPSEDLHVLACCKNDDPRSWRCAARVSGCDVAASEIKNATRGIMLRSFPPGAATQSPET